MGLQVPPRLLSLASVDGDPGLCACSVNTLPTELHLQTLSFPLGTSVQVKAHTAALSPPRVTLLANSHGQRKPGRFLKVSGSNEKFKALEGNRNPRATDTWPLSAQTLGAGSPKNLSLLVPLGGATLVCVLLRGDIGNYTGT